MTDAPADTPPADAASPDAPEIAALKAAARKRAFAARKAAHAEGAAEKAQAATARFLATEAPCAGAVVSGYRPIRTEIDPTPLMEALIGRGHRVVVPVIEGKGLPLRFRQWWPGCEMVEGPFGALIPAGGLWLDPEVLIAPLVAFDAGCWRLGYGGGFYDRTLARLSAQRPTRAVGLAYEAQRLDAIPRDATDRRLGAVVTETARHVPGGGA
jgi:5-formyltetrahydrofolate cyclo-ligase